MKILFLCTAHNSLSQRLYLVLSRSHTVSIEYALTSELMLSAVDLFAPDLVICPFLTSHIPKGVYQNYLTLIIHPGPPGDVGPSALDWLLLGDDGTIEDPDEVIQKLNATDIQPGRTHWGVSVLQAIEEFDAGPVWAFEQFAIDIDEPRLTKSALYRGAVSHAAMTATMTAISRVSFMAGLSARTWPSGTRVISPSLKADPRYSSLSVDENKPFQGGRLHNRPLLKAASREFDTDRHTARQVSRRIRSGDSQPGVLSKCFGASLYVYGGLIEENAEKRVPVSLVKMPSKILGVRNQAVCLSTCDGKGVWITHARRMKTKNDKALWPKVPATSALVALGLVTAEDVRLYDWAPVPDWKFSESQTFQEVWVNMDVDKDAIKTAYVYFDFYNGAMATDQCLHLLQALQYVLSQSTPESPVQAVVMMGGAYFGNGIALNVIEAADDPSMESWLNINGIDDVVHCLLHELPARGIVTIAAIRGNAAAGGVALAAACDIVIAGSNVVLNPAYRAIGLFGSEYHTLTYRGRCGPAKSQQILRSMMPMSAIQAQSIGLVDYVFPGYGAVLDDYLHAHITYLLTPGILKRGAWKKNVDLSPASLALTRTRELAQMSIDFWSPRAARYHTRRFDFVRKVKPSQTPLRFAVHRRCPATNPHDLDETDEYDSIDHHRRQADADLLAALCRKFDPDDVLTPPVVDVPTPVSSSPQQRGPRSHVRMYADSPVTTPAGYSMFAPPPLQKKSELLFSCYYQSPYDSLLTPPASPMYAGEIVDRINIMSQ